VRAFFYLLVVSLPFAVFCGCVQRRIFPVESLKFTTHSAALGSEEGASPPVQAPEAVARKARVLTKSSQGCTWLESEGLVTVSEQDSRHQARAAAVEEARKSAMQDFLGVEVHSRFMDFQQEGLRDQKSLTESILRTTRLGRILDEELLSEKYLDLPGCLACRYRVLLKSCLIPIPDTSDKDFRVELGLSRTRFVEGDEARLSVTASHDCYLYLYNVGMEWETALLVPNEIFPEVRLGAGQTWEYPNEEARKRGVHLVAQLPKGKNISAETIRVVASKIPLERKLKDPAGMGYLGILRRLHSSRLDWAEDIQAFTIYRR
jgi:hypothetical protein